MNFNGQVVKKARIEKGLTQEELAEMLNSGYKKQNVYSWEKGRCAPRADVLPKLAEVLGVELSLFFV